MKRPGDPGRDLTEFVAYVWLAAAVAVTVAWFLSL